MEIKMNNVGSIEQIIKKYKVENGEVLIEKLLNSGLENDDFEWVFSKHTGTITIIGKEINKSKAWRSTGLEIPAYVIKINGESYRIENYYGVYFKVINVEKNKSSGYKK